MNGQEEGCPGADRGPNKTRRSCEKPYITIGVGAEFSFAPNWSAAVEYDHLFIGNYTTTFNATTGGVFSTDRVGGGSDIFTVRVNYRWGRPIIPKYW